MKLPMKFPMTILISTMLIASCESEITQQLPSAGVKTVPPDPCDIVEAPTPLGPNLLSDPNAFTRVEDGGSWTGTARVLFDAITDPFGTGMGILIQDENYSVNDQGEVVNHDFMIQTIDTTEASPFIFGSDYRFTINLRRGHQSRKTGIVLWNGPRRLNEPPETHMIIDWDETDECGVPVTEMPNQFTAGTHLSGIKYLGDEWYEVYVTASHLNGYNTDFVRVEVNPQSDGRDRVGSVFASHARLQKEMVQ